MRESTKTDLTLAAIFGAVCLGICIIGGLYHPHTIAGAIARWFFSIN